MLLAPDEEPGVLLVPDVQATVAPPERDGEPAVPQVPVELASAARSERGASV